MLIQSADLMPQEEGPDSSHPIRIWANVNDMRNCAQKAFEESLIPEHSDKSWYGIRSVWYSMRYQLSQRGDVQRDFGKVSFLTHLMEVTHFTYNQSSLEKYDPEHRAFVPVNHDLEDVRNETSLESNYVINRVLTYLKSKKGNHRFLASARKDLFLLMDPPTVTGLARMDLQIERLPSMSKIGVYTRLGDKICTYRRDYHNMKTIDPETGVPYLHIVDEAFAKQYLAKMARKEKIIEAIPVPDRDKTEWYTLVKAISEHIDRQLNPTPIRQALKSAAAYAGNRFLSSLGNQATREGMAAPKLPLDKKLVL